MINECRFILRRMVSIDVQRRLRLAVGYDSHNDYGSKLLVKVVRK